MVESHQIRKQYSFFLLDHYNQIETEKNGTQKNTCVYIDSHSKRIKKVIHTLKG